MREGNASMARQECKLTLRESSRVSVVASPEGSLVLGDGRGLDLALGVDEANDLGQVRELGEGGVGVVAERSDVELGVDAGRRRGGDEHSGEQGGVRRHCWSGWV